MSLSLEGGSNPYINMGFLLQEAVELDLIHFSTLKDIVTFPLNEFQFPISNFNRSSGGTSWIVFENVVTGNSQRVFLRCLWLY